MGEQTSSLLISVLIIVLIVTVPIKAGNSNLNLKDIMEMALANNIDLDIAELKLENSRIDYKKNELTNLAVNSRLVKLQGEVNKLLAEENYNNIKQDTVLNIFNKYFELITVNNEIKTKKKEVELEKRKIKEVKAQVETGYKGTLDLFIQQNNYQSAVNELERNIDKKKRLIKILMFKIAAKKDYKLKIPSLTRPEIWDIKEDEAIDRAFANSNFLKITQKKVKLAEADYEKANVKNDAELNLQQKENNLTLARLNYKKEKQRLEENIMLLYADYIQSIKDIELAKNILKKARENYEIIKEQQSQGLVTDNNVLEAEVNMMKAGNNYTKSIINYYLCRLKLKQGIGLTVEVDINEKTNT